MILSRGTRWAGVVLGVVLGMTQNAWPEDDDASRAVRSQVDTVNAVNLAPRTVWESPRATSAVRREELRLKPPRMTGEALENEDAVVVLRPSYNTALPSIRGLSDARVLVLVDGIRLNTTTTSTLPSGVGNLNLIDPYLIESIEVVRGPGLATYGSDGLGGTVALRARRPVAIAGSGLELNAGSRLSYASFDQSFTGSLFGSGRWGRFTGEVAFSARHFGELTGGKDAPVSALSAFSDGGLYVGLGADVGRGQLQLVFQGGRQFDGLRSERSRPGDLYRLSEVARDLTYLRYTNSVELGEKTVDVSALVAFHRLSEQAARTQVSLDRVDRLGSRDDVLAVLANVSMDLGRGGQLSAGLEGYFDWVKSTAEQVTVGGSGTIAVNPQWLRYPVGSTAHSVAVFVGDEWDLEHLFSGAVGPKPGRWKLLVSARVGGNFLFVGPDSRLATLFSTGAQPVAARNQASLVYAGTVSLRYEFVPGAALFAGFMTGVRPASLDDTARLDLGRPGLLLPSDAPLHPETAYSGEAGFRLGYPRIEVEALYAVNYLTQPISLFSTRFAGVDCYGLVAGRCVDRLLARRNEAFALLHTVETSFRLHLFSNLHLLGSLAYTNGDVTLAPLVQGTASPENKEPMWRVPPLMGKGALQLRRPRSMLALLEAGARAYAPQNRLATSDRLDVTICPLGPDNCQGSVAFVVTYLRSALRLTRQLYLSALFENLTQQTYRIHGSGIAGPGLGAHVTLEGNL